MIWTMFLNAVCWAARKCHPIAEVVQRLHQRWVLQNTPLVIYDVERQRYVVPFLQDELSARTHVRVDHNSSEGGVT